MDRSLNVNPVWWIGIAVWLVYLAIIFGTWAVVGADYTDLASRSVIVERLVLPEVLGALFLIAVISRLGWWSPVLRETERAGPRWTMWVLLPVLAGFIALHLLLTDWSQITPVHLALIALSCALIGFNEETLTRGVAVLGWRGSTNREVWVWFATTAMFGLMHLPNGFFGIGLAGGLTQVVFTFLLGSGLYLLRRVSGTILLPMIVHALWDFASFSSQASGIGSFLMATLFQFLSYLIALVVVIVMLRHQRKSRVTRPA